MADSLTSVHHFPTEYGETPIFGGIEVPVSTITYRETLNYGGFSLGNENPGYFLKYNRMRVANQWGDQENQVTSEYYLFTLPYKVLSGETVIDFNISEDGEYWNYILTNNSSIKAPSNDHNTNGYNAFYKGNQIIGSEDGGWSVCPMDDSRIAFYAMNDRILSYKLPEDKQQIQFLQKHLCPIIRLLTGLSIAKVKSLQTNNFTCLSSDSKPNDEMDGTFMDLYQPMKMLMTSFIYKSAMHK